MISLPEQFTEIPESYKEQAEAKGKVEKLFYTCPHPKGGEQEKYLFVYTPAGYDPEKEYEILYMIHGGHELQDKYMYLDGEDNVLKRIVDNLIEKGDIKPCVICMPSWYPLNTISDEIDSRLLTMEFHKELSEVIMPMIETKYHTFAKTADLEGFKASRNHRALIGWSMGSVTTWFTMMRRMDCFDRFGNMSADCFLVKPQGCIDHAEETVAALVHMIKSQGYGADDFTEMAVTGTNDGLRKGMEPMVEELKKYPEVFRYEGEKPNARFYLWEGGEHHTPWRLLYTYNVIKTLLAK